MITENHTGDTQTGVLATTLNGRQVYHGPADDVSMTVVLAIADVEGVDPLDLEFRLNDYVDPDALDELFAGRNLPTSDAEVSLHIAGHDVRVSPGGEVRIA